MRALRAVVCTTVVAAAAITAVACGGEPPAGTTSLSSLSTITVTVTSSAESTASSATSETSGTSQTSGINGSTSTTEPAPASSEAGSRDKPVPVGEEKTVGDWTVSVGGFTPNADETVANYNEFNTPPESGAQYVIVRIRALNAGEAETPIDGGLYHAFIGGGGKTFEAAPVEVADSVGEGPEVQPGDAVEANLVFQVTSTDVEGGLLMLEPGAGGTQVFFSLE